MEYISRQLETTIHKYLKSPEILAITGPRQAGKTTLIKRVYENLHNAIFLSFEDKETLELFETDIKEFSEKYKQYDYIFIDEFQYSKVGGKYLKYIYDTYNIKIIISGSSAIDLTVNAVKFLTGRIFIFHLYPLTWSEFLNYKDKHLHQIYTNHQSNLDLSGNKIKNSSNSEIINNKFHKLLEEFVTWGGYPRVVLSSDPEEKRLVLKNIYNTYFLRDVRDILGLIDDYKLSRLIKATALQIGNLINYSELAQITGYNHITLKKYLNSLEKTFILKSIQPLYKNKRTEILKNPKLYFYDLGLRNYIVNNFNPSHDRTDKGELYENYIFSELIKRDIEFNYWRTKNKQEVDFVIKAQADKLIPVEIKTSHKPKDTGTGLKSFIKQYSPDNALIINLNSQPSPTPTPLNGTNIYNLPNWMI